MEHGRPRLCSNGRATGEGACAPLLPCVLYEDDDLLVANKPAGIATHRTGELDPWGLVELLEDEFDTPPKLGVHQRLDRETSGVMVFSKSVVARQSLARQFEGRAVRKHYLLATGQTIGESEFTASETIQGKPAETRFRFQRRLANGLGLWEAMPATGRNHQVRIHAANHGLAIVGDQSGPGSVKEPLLLHAARLELEHPSTGRAMIFEAPLPSVFETADLDERRLRAAVALRTALIDGQPTDICRWIFRAADGFPAFTADHYGGWVYVECFDQESCPQAFVNRLTKIRVTPDSLHGIVVAETSSDRPRQEKRLAMGVAPPDGFTVSENGVRYRVDLLRPGATGLFLDQHHNRRHLRRIANGQRVLNLFAYTCGFSVAATAGGARGTVNVDLARPALNWGRENFRANHLSLEPHQFLAMDVWDALARLRKKVETFGIVLVDPPSSSRSKSSGHFSAQKDFPALIREMAPLVAPGGWLFCSCNLATWKSADYLDAVEESIRRTKRQVVAKTWMPQPFDFPAIAGQPPYFKSVWLQLA